MLRCESGKREQWSLPHRIRVLNCTLGSAHDDGALLVLRQATETVDGERIGEPGWCSVEYLRAAVSLAEQLTRQAPTFQIKRAISEFIVALMLSSAPVTDVLITPALETFLDCYIRDECYQDGI